MMRDLWMVSVCLMLLVAACSSRPSNNETLTLAVAASLQPAMEEIAAAFEEETGASIAISSGASGLLYRQAREGAPFDLFISADTEFPSRLSREGFIDPSSLRTFARGTLVLWQRDDTQPRIQSLDDLRKHNHQDLRLAIANPEAAPYGRAAKQVLESLRFPAGQIVLGTNVAQAFQYAETGNVAAAFVSASLVPTAGGSIIEVPQNLYDPIEHSMGILSRTKNPALAAQFHQFLIGEKAQSILARHGFLTPSGEAA